jgi:putative ABC transport system permease protein
MLWFAFRGVISRRVSTGLAALGLLTSTLGFIGLASTSKTTEATLRGDIGRAWQTPYDLLVRPPGSATALERSAGLVRPNFLSGLVGGISMTDLKKVRSSVGVQVAAPIAMLGFIDAPTAFSADLTKEITPGLNVFRLSGRITADAGLSTYPFTSYLVVDTNAGTLQAGASPEQLQLGTATLPCPYEQVECVAPRLCNSTMPTADHCGPVPIDATWLHNWPLPIGIAGIDPTAENQLAGLDHCVTSGRPLGPTEGLPVQTVVAPGGQPLPEANIPILAASTSFLDESVQIDVSKAGNPERIFTSGPESLAGWRSTESVKVEPDPLYKSWLDLVSGGSFAGGAIGNLLVPGDVSYGSAGPGLVASPRAPDLSVFTAGNGLDLTPQQIAPLEAADTWFRGVTEHPWVNQVTATQPAERLNVVGRYDPRCLRGFNPLSGGRLETYAPPTVQLPGNRTLGPTTNPGGYVNSPPLLLTDLAGAAFMARPDRWQGSAGDRFISAIRVRVAGTDQPGAVAQARLARVAADIAQATGLLVDIVKGSSPKTIKVDLAPGKFGRPALTVSEGWSVKGVAFRFIQAVSAQNLALFVFILLAAMVLVGQVAYTAVKRRRSEFGVLRAMGWPAWRVTWLVEMEMLLIGLAVGVLALAVGFGLAQVLGLQTASWQWLAAVPLAVMIAGLASAIPALTASRGATALVMSGRGTVRRSRIAASVLALGAQDLVRGWLGEAILGTAAVAMGSALFGGVVLIAAGFRGQLDTSVLGTYVAARVQPFHLVLAVLTLAIGALTAGEIVTLSYLQRQAQLATLHALGWPRQRLVQLLGGQVLVLALAGGLTGGAVVVASGLLLGAALATTITAAASGFLVAILATGLGAAGPLWLVYRLRPAAALREE